MKAIDETLPPDKKAEIEKLHGYQNLKSYNVLADVLLIENRDPEVASSPFDFSRRSIERRKQAGCNDMSDKLREVAYAAAPPKPGPAFA